MTRSIFTILIIVLIGCKPSYPPYYGFPKKREIVHLNKAKKLNPDEVEHLFIQGYEDSIFPNGDILKFRNLKSLFIVGRWVKSKKSDSITLPPLKLTIDTNGLKKMKNMKLLDMSFFDFSEFPSEFLLLDQLEYLVLGSSLISDVPPEINKLKKLDHLSFRLNNLTSLPTEISSLKKLRAIDLANNRLDHIPDFLLEMDSLSFISLANTETKTEMPNGVWYWPFHLYTNDINYFKSLDKLETLATKGHNNINIQVNNSLEKERLKNRMSEKLETSIKIIKKE